MRKLLLPALVLALLAPRDLSAWGADGHRTVAEIAQRRLSRKAARQLSALLGDTTLATIATWADEVRNTPRYQPTSPWHYVNLPQGLDQAAFTQQLRAKAEPNAFQALNDNLRLLADKQQPREKRLEALKFIVHIVGDVHQPMHVSRAEDKGGNDIKLHYHDHDSNLHRLWDSDLIKTQGLAYPQMVATHGQPRRQQARQWRRDAPEQWLFESYQISAQLYTAAQPDANLGEPYYTANISTVRQRLQQGGVRLAAVLNEALQ